MSRIHQDLEYMEFPQPSGIEQASICEETGLLPRTGCPVITEYFDIGSMPTEYCDQHFYEVEEEYETDPEDSELTPTPSEEDPNEGGESTGEEGSGEGSDPNEGDWTEEGGDWTEEEGTWDEETGQYYYYY